MSEQTNAQTNECTNARMNERTNARMNERTNARMYERTNVRTNVRRRGRTEAWTDGGVDGQRRGRTEARIRGYPLQVGFCVMVCARFGAGRIGSVLAAFTAPPPSKIHPSSASLGAKRPKADRLGTNCLGIFVSIPAI
jgi:hypothetical protein